jgi:hypothetical protein
MPPVKTAPRSRQLGARPFKREQVKVIYYKKSSQELDLFYRKLKPGAASW